MRTINLSYWVIVCLNIVLFGNLAHGEQSDFRELRVGIVDMQKVLQTSLVVQKIEKQKEVMRNKYKQDATALQNSIIRKNKELEDKRAKLSATEFERLYAEFEKEIMHTQKVDQEHKLELDQKHFSAMAVVNNKIEKIIQFIAEKHNLSLVLPASQTLFYNNSIDLSSEVLSVLNKELSNIEVYPSKISANKN